MEKKDGQNMEIGRITYLQFFLIFSFFSGGVPKFCAGRAEGVLQLESFLLHFLNVLRDVRIVLEIAAQDLGALQTDRKTKQTKKKTHLKDELIQ